MIAKIHKGGRIGFCFDDLGEITIMVPSSAHIPFELDEEDGGGVFLSRGGIDNAIEMLKKARDEYDRQFNLKTG